MKYFTSDTHFNHVNCIKFDNRPFENIEDMNESIIKNWNKVVSPEDEVYHLGDVAFGRGDECLNILNSLNGKIYLVKGNHEKTALNGAFNRFEWVKDYYELKYEGHLFILCHYPFASWRNSHYNKSINLHGHCHGNQGDRPVLLNQLDVGTCCHNYAPISIKQVMEKLKDANSIIHVD
jgi:calcineurin-like phosphoesterase family protein